RGHPFPRIDAANSTRRVATASSAAGCADGDAGHPRRCRTGTHSRRPPRHPLGGGWPKGRSGPPGNEANDVRVEDETARHFSARLVPVHWRPAHLLAPGILALLPHMNGPSLTAFASS